MGSGCPENRAVRTPRPAAELCGGDGQHVWDGAARVVRVVDGKDLTEAFRMGAERAHQAAPQAKLAILKARSPSCGVRQTSIEGRFQSGMGVFAALLKRAGIPIISDEDWSNQRGSSHTRKPKLRRNRAPCRVSSPSQVPTPKERPLGIAKVKYRPLGILAPRGRFPPPFPRSTVARSRRRILKENPSEGRVSVDKR